MIFDRVHSDAIISGSAVSPQKFKSDKNQVLLVENLSVLFGGFVALNQLNFAMCSNEIKCLIGPNGAGKTTLIDVLTGRVKPNQGSAIFLDHIRLSDKNESEINQLGIGRKFQKPSVFEAQSVFENLELALNSRKTIFNRIFKKISSSDFDRILAVSELINLFPKLGKSAGILSHGEKQWLEMGMLMVSDPKLMLLDEPVAGMSRAEADRTSEMLRSLSTNRAILVVEHDMEFVRKIADNITVMDQGSVIAEGNMMQIQNDRKVREVYLGDEKSSF